MTNEEKYTTAEERGEAFANFCLKFQWCDECPAYKRSIYCRFGWLELEAEEEPMNATEVADILEEYNKWRNGKGTIQTNEDLDKAFDRAIELLRSIKE